MDWARSWVGIGTSGTTKAPPKKHAIVERHEAASLKLTHAEQLAAQERAQTMQLMQKQRQLSAAEQACATAKGPALKDALLRKRELTTQIAKQNAALSNTRAQRRVTDTAAANIEQALLMKRGAAVLKDLNAAAETIDVAGAMDDLEDGAAQVADVSEVLERPLNLDPTLDMDEIDAELEAEMARREEEEALKALDTAPAAGTGVVKAAVPSARPIAAAEEVRN
jgi:hypothetical protein